jgi:glycerol uptake facilitator protein
MYGADEHVAAAARKGLQLKVLERVTGEGDARRAKRYSLWHQCAAELVGVMLIVVFGVGSVCSAVLFPGGLVGLWQVAVVWGFGVALAIAATASVSGAHLNPAVSLALALFRPLDFPWRKLLPYWAAQYAGGVLGGVFNLMVYGRQFRHFERVHGIVRGSPESVATAMAFGEYFPNPGFAASGAIDASVVSPVFAMFVEAWGTGVLMFVILALTDPNQKLIRSKEMLPLLIGFTVAVLISLYAPLTQAGWNPARDFGPRVVAALAGWGRVAIPGPRNGFWIYIVGPKIGAPIGALMYDLLLKQGAKLE